MAFLVPRVHASVFQKNIRLRAMYNERLASFKIIINIEKRRSIFRSSLIVNELQRRRGLDSTRK